MEQKNSDQEQEYPPSPHNRTANWCSPEKPFPISLTKETKISRREFTAGKLRVDSVWVKRSRERKMWVGKWNSGEGIGLEFGRICLELACYWQIWAFKPHQFIQAHAHPLTPPFFTRFIRAFATRSSRRSVAGQIRTRCARILSIYF